MSTHKYPCGCVNNSDNEHSILRSESKCPNHTRMMRDPATLDQKYYEELSAIINGVPQCTRQIGELREALGDLPVGKLALEVGCGVSLYCPLLLKLGYAYTGLDASPWACKWTSNAYDVRVHCVTLDQYESEDAFDLLMAAHCLEHVDAPAVVAKFNQLVKPNGNLCIIVPDDSDPVNPDHLWFFTTQTLTKLLEANGFVVDKMEVRKRVAHENFIYCLAMRV